MADWRVEVRTPVAGGAWTNVSNYGPFSFSKRVNTIWQANATVIDPSSSLQALLIRDNEFRIRDATAGKEWFRGRIRGVTRDEVGKIWTLVIDDNMVLLQNRTWRGRRDFPAVPAGVILDEINSSNEGEPRNGQLLHYDMETLSGSDMKDLSGNSRDGTINGTLTSVTGRFGLAREFPIDGTNYISRADEDALDPTNYTIFAFFRVVETITGNLGVEIAKKFSATGYELFMDRIAGDAAGQLKMGATHNGTTVRSSLFSVSINVLHTAIWTYDGTTIKGTVDGVTQLNTALAAYTASAAAFEIGKSGIAVSLQTQIDQFYFYNRVLAAGEIEMLSGTSILTGGLGTIDSFTAMKFRAEQERRLNIADALAKAVSAELKVDRDANDKDRLNLVSRIGSASSQDTFKFGATARLSDRRIDSDGIVNDIAVIGNTGVAQIASRNFHATTLRTTLNADLSSSATTATVVSTTGFPTSGILFIGMERVRYTGTTGTTFTGLTRAYTGDGYPSLAAYEHKSGIEVYLHADEAAAPDVYYTPEAPQTASSIKDNGWRQAVFTDQYYNDQSALDSLAQRFIARLKNERETVLVDVYEDAITADIGDTVTIQNTDATAYQNSPYRIIAYRFDFGGRRWSMELGPNQSGLVGGYRPSLPQALLDAQTRARQAALFVPDAATKGTIQYTATDVSIVTTTELVAATTRASGVKSGTRVAILGWASFVPGTGTTQAELLIRRGTTISSPSVGEPSANQVTAATNRQLGIIVSEVAASDDPQYSVTIKQTGATANGTLSNASVIVIPIG